ncbi:MAG: outer membrane protein assembly factor BamE, partial [OM182 bacterium]
TRSQVRFVLGNPILDDNLNRDRWDYIYTIQISGGETKREILILHFLEDKLSFFETNLRHSDDNRPSSA